jgi:hypothetical protein
MVLASGCAFLTGTIKWLYCESESGLSKGRAQALPFYFETEGVDQMPKFSELNLQKLKSDLDQKDSDFIAEMKAIRIATDSKLSASKAQLDNVLTELRQFDRETKNQFKNPA